MKDSIKLTVYEETLIADLDLFFSKENLNYVIKILEGIKSEIKS